MKWDYSSINEYIQAKEYVDTAVIPLLLIECGEQIISSTRLTNYVLGLGAQIEDQLKGRIMLFPPYTFVTQFSDDMLNHALNTYSEELRYKGFKNVVFLTQNDWIEERQLTISGDILKVTSTDIEEVRALQEKIRAEGKQLVSQFIKLWKR